MPHPDPTLSPLYDQLVTLTPAQRRELEAQLAILRAGENLLSLITSTLDPPDPETDSVAIPHLAAIIAERVELELAEATVAGGSHEDITAVADFIDALVNGAD